MGLEANSLTKNDALDFCHAVVGCAYSNFTTLDTTWKRRIGMLPKPNWLASVYSREGSTKWWATFKRPSLNPASASSSYSTSRFAKN
jgi:hypothetical protein